MPPDGTGYDRWRLKVINGKSADEPPATEAPSPPPDEDHDAGLSEPDLAPAAPFRSLGHDRGTFFFLTTRGEQVLAFPGRDLSREGVLMQLASWNWWMEPERFGDGKGGVKLKDAADRLIADGYRVGIYDPDRIRGRGAWLDDKKAVLHLGDRLIVNGRTHALELDGSRYIYEAARALALPEADPLSNGEANRLVKLCNRLSWERPVSGTLLAGWIALAPICGGLKWRPSIWLTGGSGSGKSTVQTGIVAATLGGMALYVLSNTSEAGIRQALTSDARPVVFDEAERDDAAAQIRFKAVLDLVRQSSSEGGGEIVKGTQNQAGVRRYRIRSCFMFSSINVGLQHQADENRVTVLSLSKPRLDNKAFAKLEEDIAEALTPAFAAGLLARSVWLLPIIRANAETFARAVSQHLGSRRAGDQLGSLLAGAYSLHSDRLITAEEAAKYVAKHQWTDAAPEDVLTDEQRLLAFITQHRVRVSLGAMPPVETTLGRLIEAADGRDEAAVPPAAARAQLQQSGIKWVPRFDADGQQVASGFSIANNHPVIEAMLKITPWATAWHRTLSRLPGATNADNKVVRFGPGAVSKATYLPMEVLGADTADDG